MRDLVIGLGNLPFPQTECFLNSLAATSFAGDVCFFAYDIDADSRQRMRARGVQLESGARFLVPGRHVMNSRFFMCLDFIATHASRYDRVMITDVRDVVFQSNPFDRLGGVEIWYACEQARIAACPINGAWVYQAYGYGVLENIRDYFTSCAGTTLGSTRGILRYLAAMVDEFAKCSILERNIDQGIHNYVVHMRPLEGAYLDLSDAIVATCNHLPADSLAVTARGIEVRGELPAVVHQWDRRPAASAHVGSRFHEPTASPTPRRKAAVPAWPARPPDPAPPTLYGPAPSSARFGPALAADAVLAFAAPADLQVLGRFIAALRRTGFEGWIIVCAGQDIGIAAVPEWDESCRAERFELDPAIPAANAAHCCFAAYLEGVEGRRVLAIDNIRARPQLNPFGLASAQVSVSAEGCRKIRDCKLNTQWVSAFGTECEDILERQIVSSEIVMGAVADLRRFYGLVMDQFRGRAHLMRLEKIIQGAIARVAYGAASGVTVHPNGTLRYSAFWPSEMIVEPGELLRVGGVVPAIVCDVAAAA